MRLTIVVGMVAGGVGVHVRSMVEHLPDHGIEVGVVGPAETNEQFRFTEAGARFAPVEIGSAPRPIADIQAIAGLKRAFRGTDIVHAHGLRAAGLSGLALGRRRPGRIPLLATWHNAILTHGIRRVVATRLEALAAKRADITLGVSSDLAERARHLRAPDARLMHIAAPALSPPTVDKEDVRAQFDAKDRPLIVVVSRLAKQKGLDTLVAAAQQWRDIMPRPVVVVAGDGGERSRLQAIIDRDDLDVRLLGRREDISDLLAAADLYLMTSLWEGRPLVIQEAMRFGLPVVTTAVGGIPELVGDSAEFIPVNDPSATADAVLRVLNDPQKQAELAKRSREQARDWPDHYDNAQTIAALCRELVGN